MGGRLLSMLVAVVGLGANVALGRPATASPADPPAAPTVIQAVYSGNGCPQGSRNELRPDTDSLDVAMYAFNGNFGDTGSMNCEVHLTLSGGAPGWALSLETVRTTGLLRQNPGTEVAFFTTVYWSQTAANTITKERRIRNTDSGPNTRDVALKQQISSVSPCGQLGILNINFRAALTDGSGASFGGYNPDAPVTDELAFAWKQC